MFESQEFQIDENSFEFRSLNPSTRVDPESGKTIATATHSASDESDGSESDSAESDLNDSDNPPVRSKTKNAVVMRVSSSNPNDSRHDHNTALGSRSHKQSRTAKARGGDVVGEKEVTMPNPRNLASPTKVSSLTTSNSYEPMARCSFSL
jgi:ribosome biogenesis protein ENP2